MKTSVKWVDDLSFVVKTNSKHSLLLSADTDYSPSPMELILAALGGCSSIDVVSILRKGRHQVTACEAKIEAERADTVPRVFTRIRVVFEVKGKDLKPEAVQRAVELSMSKYCSVTKMLEAKVSITWDYRLLAD